MVKPGRPSSGSASFFGARTGAARERVRWDVVRRDSRVASPMGKQSTTKQPPRLWPCEKAVLAGFEPRNASSRTPRDTGEGPEDSTGVTGEREPHDDDDMTLVLAVTAGATAAAFVLGGVGYVLWLLAQQPAVVLERVAAVVTLAVGFGAMVLGMERGR